MLSIYLCQYKAEYNGVFFGVFIKHILYIPKLFTALMCFSTEGGVLHRAYVATPRTGWVIILKRQLSEDRAET